MKQKVVTNANLKNLKVHIKWGGRVLRNLVVMDLPFYDVHQTLLEPMELPAILSGAKTPCKQSFSFSIPRESLGNWSQLLPLPRFEIQLRFFQVPVNYASQELADDFPLNCIARVEDQIVQLPSVIPTNKPNVEPKRPSRPVDITQNCLSARDATRPVRLMVEWTGDRRTWAVAVYLVYRVTSEILRDRATGVANNSVSGNKEVLNHWQEDHVTRDLIRARLSGATDDDIAMAQLKISLLCPLSRTRITLPARCKKCSHLQCFDLYNYLQMNEKRPTWRCPVCSDWAPFKYIIIDGYFQKVLASVDIEAVEIELLADGSYRTVKSECVNMDDDDMPSMSTANNAQSPLPNVTMAVSYPNKPRTNIEDVIVLSDSDDEEREAVDQAIRMSLSDSAPSSTTPNPRSRDSSIIILDDESPPRSTAALIQNTTGSQSSSSLPTILTLPSTSTHTLVTTATSTAAITSNVLGVTSRITAPQSHSVLNGRQSVYNNTASLPYYHQSQWSQTSASRPQYPTSQVQGLSTGATFPITYKTTQTRNLLGRYQPNNSSAHSFNYTNPSDPPQVQPFGTSVPNIEQVLASLVQQSTYSNGGVSTVDYDC
ncbi:MIZ/SP-RING zinc finger [Dictyocaulus viviparus]|uniref:MIZ/SP-RING zinc finger n=1 Tax=Dictyocaulus viviparus TaxID=29172 RepID=A0A0D8Y4A6_DICVI|nr:MIZ/SP-RING zinc finger [Dictyocaulus viviparus]